MSQLKVWKRTATWKVGSRGRCRSWSRFLPGSPSILLVAILVFLGGCAGGAGQVSTEPGAVEEGGASYYAHKFHGRTTASGEIYDENKMTAAHKTLPFGTTVRVTNLANGKKVVVRINDRGPFVEGRIIDLSYRAAGELGMHAAGVVDARVEILRTEGDF